MANVKDLKKALFKQLKGGKTVVVGNEYIDYVPGLQQSGSVSSRTNEEAGTVKSGKFLGIKPFATKFRNQNKKLRGMAYVQTDSGVETVSLLLLTKKEIKRAIKKPEDFHGKTFEQEYPNVPKISDNVKIIAKPFLTDDGKGGQHWVFLYED